MHLVRVLAGALLGVLAGLMVVSATPAGVEGALDALASALTNPRHLESAARFMAPIAVAGAGLAIAYRAGFITIGAEGQMLVASITALWVYEYSSLDFGRPAVAALLAVVVGVVWGIIPGLLRAFMSVNEVLTSLMLNYVALSLVNHLVSGPMRSGAFTQTRFIGEDAMLPAGFLVFAALAFSGSLEAFRRWTMIGASLEAFGTAPRAARTYLITGRRAILYAALISGVAGGLAGFLMLSGFQRGFTALSSTPGYGYMGVLAAWLGLRSPLGAMAAAMLFSVLVVAGYLLQPQGVPASVALLIQALAVLGVALSARGARSG